MTKREFEDALERLRTRLVKLREDTEATGRNYDVAMLAHWRESEDIAHTLQELRTALDQRGQS